MAMNRITAPLLPALYDTNVLTFCVEIHGLESTNQYSDPFEAYYFLIYECMRWARPPILSYDLSTPGRNTFDLPSKIEWNVGPIK